MSIHSSLRSSGTSKHRSVLKRHERLKSLKDRHIWDDQKSALGLPKVKQQKLKVKKEKAAAETAAAPGAAATAAAAPAAKGAAAAKPAQGAAAKTDKK